MTAPRPAGDPPEPAAEIDDHGSVARQVVLGVVVFVATFVLLLGLTRLAAGPGAAPPSGEPTGGAGAPSASGGGAAPASPTGPASPGQPSPTDAASSSPPTGSATPTPAGGDPVLVGAGDIGDCGSDGDEATAALLDQIAGTVFTAGDNAYARGTLEDFQACFDPSWGRHLARIRPAAGNHDWETGDLAGYRAYFGQAGLGPTGDAWYSYELGTWHVITLDSDCAAAGGCGPDSEQGQWLAADLAASNARCTVAIWHHPRFSSGFHGDIADSDPLFRALYEAGADVVITGHEHSYERFAPQDPDGREDRDRGLRQFVVGTGGTALRAIERVAPNSELRASLDHGVLAVTLRDGSYAWRFHAATTDFSDSGATSCH